MGPPRNSKRKAAVPLAPPPHAASMKSRKRARQVTTLFHKYTREKDLAIFQGADAATLQELDDKIEAIGGRKTYQEASQLSTSFHSTSKWVLGVLQRKGWLYGIRVPETVDSCVDNNNDEGDHRTEQKKREIGSNDKKDCKKKTSKKKRQRRDANLLEIGAINTELLDAAERATESYAVATDAADPAAIAEEENSTKKYRLKVRAIDIHSMHPGRIEEADFLKLPLPPTAIINNSSDENCQEKRYDVIVCSMVLNCVTTPEDRGEMLTRIYDFLRPGGIAFLTIPKLCLTQSPFVNRETFVKLLGATGVGFEVEKITKESPKVSFFICHRPEENTEQQQSTGDPEFDTRWTTLKKIHKGKKYRNQFAVVLKKERILATKRCGTGGGGG